MIEVKGLYKSFEGKTVLHNIDATFENGKTSLIIGQSGSGKTVLMKCIVGLLTPEKGEVLYDGRNFLAMGKKEKKHLRREMGMIFQSAALFDSMSVLDNVMFPLNMFGTDTLREQTKRAMFCLDRVNLTEAKDKLIDRSAWASVKTALWSSSTPPPLTASTARAAAASRSTVWAIPRIARP